MATLPLRGQQQHDILLRDNGNATQQNVHQRVHQLVLLHFHVRVAVHVHRSPQRRHLYAGKNNNTNSNRILKEGSQMRLGYKRV